MEAVRFRWINQREDAIPDRTDGAMTFRGDRLKELRKAAKLSQGELAKLAGIQLNTIYTYEVGKRYPPLNILSRIVEALKTNSAYLLDEIDYPGPLTKRESDMLRDFKRRGENVNLDDFLNEWSDYLPKKK
jgi:transcriptional regulator with XRE-family HTH domain